jgi:phenylpropionate dioxygenase-like ring-hydroxylating dioxygenase large terminal subunit
MAQDPKAETPAARKQPFGGYYNRIPHNDDTLLTHVGPGTPCGEYMRRYWQPFLLASELKDLPIAVRLLGEDLVVFRDKSGRLGLLHRNCAHRGASLEFGIIAERGIRCCYHGWHFDVDGTILDTPAEPQTSRIKSNFCQGAYHVREEHGLLFAYMGPPEQIPELPIYDTLCYPDITIAPFKVNVPANWLQIVENAADPIHNAFLHAIMSESGEQFAPAFKVLPALDFIETPLGMLSMATRKLDGRVFIRAGELMLPNIAQFTSGGNEPTKETVRAHSTTTRWAVPLDDHNSLYIGAAHWDERSAPRSRSADDYGVDKFPLIGQTADRPYRERQREPGDYDAVVSGGAIVNRKAEHLGTTDRGVVMIRRMLAAAIRTTLEGKVPSIPRLPESERPVRTYSHEVVLNLSDPTALADPTALYAFGNRAAKAIIDTDDIPAKQRDEVARSRIQKILAEAMQSAHAPG